MSYNKEAVVVEPVCTGALWDWREVEVLDVPTAVGQRPEGLGAGGKLVAAVSQGGEVRAMDTGQPEHSAVEKRENSKLSEGVWRIFSVEDSVTVQLPSGYIQ